MTDKLRAVEPEGEMRRFWQLVHHLVAHPLVGFSFGRVWAWQFHDWTAPKAWPDQEHEPARRWAGLE